MRIAGTFVLLLVLAGSAAAGDPAERIARAFELGGGGAESVPELTGSLADADPVVRATAAAALGRIGAAAGPAVDALRRSLTDASVRSAAAKALARIAPDRVEVAREITALLAAESDVTREEGVRALVMMGGTAVLPLLTLQTDRGAAKLARDAAARALARIGDRAVPALRETLKTGNRALRWAAILAAADLGERAAPAKAELLAVAAAGEQDAWNAVWARCALILVTGESEPHLGKIRAALDDRQVWKAAVQALVRLGPRAAPAIPDLVRMLDEEDRDRRWQAAIALGEMGKAGQPALPALEAHDGRNVDPDPYVRDAIRAAIQKLQSAR